MAERTIPLRLSDFADQLEAQQAPHNLVLHMRAGADDPACAVGAVMIRPDQIPDEVVDVRHTIAAAIRALVKQSTTKEGSA